MNCVWLMFIMYEDGGVCLCTRIGDCVWLLFIMHEDGGLCLALDYTICA